MEGRELNPTLAAGKIEKWLNVYDSDADSTLPIWNWVR